MDNFEIHVRLDMAVAVLLCILYWICRIVGMVDVPHFVWDMVMAALTFLSVTNCVKVKRGG